ncbi:Dihydroorotase [invertebrate metagenome]|uniref:dihydroorotase n=1 Tax=invertebrate metagenome TaxID=1711999 RepID=A0A2H9T5I2_9ZZZZ
MTDSLTIVRPDDWHIHLRDGTALQETVPRAAKTFSRAIVMPNLLPPITTADSALAYRQRILEHRPSDNHFSPLMTLYLTDNTTRETVIQAKAAGIMAFKLYPAGATTNSDSGVTDITRIYDALEAMVECDLLLLLHGEVTDPNIDIFDREKVFIDRILIGLIERFPTLRIVMEHITTADAAAFVRNSGDLVAATITAHHLLYNRNDMLVGGIKPHYYCLPILKRNRHQRALLEAATGDNPCFFLGTDSAPHVSSTKESACGCAGCYTAPAALEMYAEAFDSVGALEQLESFASFRGPDFYRLPRNTETVTLHRKQWTMPTSIPFAQSTVTPLRAGETMHWHLENDPA